MDQKTTPQRRLPLIMKQTTGFETKLNLIVGSGQPYTIKVEIKDRSKNRYETEIDVLQGGVPHEAIRKATTAILSLCDDMPTHWTFLDVNYMATA